MNIKVNYLTLGTKVRKKTANENRKDFHKVPLRSIYGTHTLKVYLYLTERTVERERTKTDRSVQRMM